MRCCGRASRNGRLTTSTRPHALVCARRCSRTLSRLSTPTIYERFAEARKASAIRNDSATPRQAAGTSRYDQFITDMKNGGFRRLFEDKPVLLRLIATVTRQWLDTWREFIVRLDTDIAAIRRDILRSGRRSEGRRHCRRSFRSAQQRPFGPDRHLRGRFADRLQAEGFARRCRLVRLGRAFEPRRIPTRAKSRTRNAAGRSMAGPSSSITRDARIRRAASDSSAAPVRGLRSSTVSPPPTRIRKT